jgi:O-antigen biosynthesis protein
MRLSIFTPTHDPRYLNDCFMSLLGQTYSNWEWVLVPNNKISLPTHIIQHPRVKIVEYPLSTTSIGALKRFACAACSGDLFVELDHDDILLPHTLEKLANASDTAGFLYSDAAAFENGSLTPVVFNEQYGWQTYPVDAFGQRFLATASFPLTARSLCEIFYAPDHVRAWRRDSYRQAGGHDPDLGVGDDHDLVCRTYLAGIAFRHIGGCGYLYRTHGDNTVIHRSDLIQEQQSRNCAKYLDLLINEWCRREHYEMLDLADLLASSRSPGAALAALDSISESTIGKVTGYDVLQLHSPSEVIALFNAIYRILVPGGWFVVSVPSTDGRGAFQDLRHVTFWNDNSWRYFSDGNLARFYPALRARFQCVRSSTSLHQESGISYAAACFSALKGQRQPGMTHI